METPSDKAGYYTELTMKSLASRIERRGEAPLTTGQFNSIYEAVYATLKKEVNV
jgi:hypothetical protein